MVDIINGKYISVYCETKYTYIIENVLNYYDIEKYKNTCVYVMLYQVNREVVENFNHIIFYNVEHVYCYGEKFANVYKDIVNYTIENNKLAEFWDFDILNYKFYISHFPKLIQHYKFVPFRYVYRNPIEKNNNKKFDAIHIGVTRFISPFRDTVLYHINEKTYFGKFPQFSLIEIERSIYSLEELYNEINLAKVVLNIPRLQHTGQEQVRIGELISMNCDVATVTHGISYMEKYVHEVDYFSPNIYDEIKNLDIYENVAEQFKNDTSNENYNKYLNECLNKWYKTNNSYLCTAIIASVKQESLNKTIESIKRNNLFNRIQIIIVDVSNNSDIEFAYNNEYKYFENIYYTKSEKRNLASAFNIGMKCAIGKYVNFLTSGDTYFPLYFDNTIDYMELNPNIDIRITEYLSKGYIMVLSFETTKIGPILQCCMFKREILTIQFDENDTCFSNIFTGILCKKYKYEYAGGDIADRRTVGWIEPDHNDAAILDKPKMPENFDWVKHTQNKINEY